VVFLCLFFFNLALLLMFRLITCTNLFLVSLPVSTGLGVCLTTIRIDALGLCCLASSDKRRFCLSVLVSKVGTSYHF
jgi:hypothetical protein